VTRLRLADHLEQKGTLSSAGGLQYVARLVRDTATAANMATYVEIVRERGSLRALTSLAADLTAQSASGSGANLADVVQQTQDRLQHIKTRAAAGGAHKPMDWRALCGDPPPRSWWIQNWLGPTPTICAGGGGVGKTKIAQAVGSSLATCKPYLECSNSSPLRVLMWFCEDHEDEIWRTQAAINSHLGITMDDLEGHLFAVPRLGLDNTLMGIEYGQPVFTPVFEELREQVNDLAADVLVLDNIAQVYGGISTTRIKSRFSSTVLPASSVTGLSRR